jgi:tetratricopeptide (TPR) repeat protein
MRCLPLRYVFLSALMCGSLAPRAGLAQAIPLPPITNALIIADDLEPTTDGPGPCICEPVAKNADTATADFGAGCARWLQFALGANVELGQTPVWDAQARGIKEIGARNMRLTTGQAVLFAKRVGYTHIALGEISGAPTHCTLSYQLLAMPEQKPVGALLKATGSEAEIVAALPGMARQLLTLLKVAKPHLPTDAHPSPAALQTIGHYAWFPDAVVSESDRKKMEALATRQPLAGILTLLHLPVPEAPSNAFDKLVEAKCRLLFTQAPDNLMVLSAFTSVRSSLSKALQAEIDRKAPDRADNAIVAEWLFAGNRSVDDSTPQHQDTITAAEQTVRFAPRNPTAWLHAAYVYDVVAEQYRKKRTAGLVSRADEDTMRKFEEHVIVTAEKATELDPDYGFAWTELARGAAAVGQYTLGENALEAALRLNNRDPRSYMWGLQMYGRSWLNKPDKLAEVARLTLADETLQRYDVLQLSNSLRMAGFSAESQTMHDRAMQIYRAAASKQPESAEAHRILGFLLFKQRQFEEAAAEQMAALRIEPDNADAHYDLGLVYANMKRLEDALTELRKALKSAPNYAPLQVDMRMLLWLMKRYDEAEGELKKALVADPDNYNALYAMTDICVQQKRFQEGIPYCEKALTIYPTAGDPNRMLCQLHNGTHQYDKAVKAGEAAVYYGPNVYLNEVSLADAYFGNAQYTESLDHYLKAVNLNKKDPRALVGIGKAEIRQGPKKLLGIEQLKLVVRLYPDTPFAAEAKQFLIENP